MHFIRSRKLFVLAGTLWVTAVTLGLSRVWTYESTPDAPAHARPHWPADTRVARHAGLPTLVLLAHPHCPCSRATIGELAKLMTTCHGKLTAAVLMLRPAGVPDGWERTGLWSSAAAIPGVSVMCDVGGVEARRFGAATSGQTLLYSADGQLLFAGGITESRGHSGDNAGTSAIVAMVLNGVHLAQPAHTPVFGCPLFDESSTCLNEGGSVCPSK